MGRTLGYCGKNFSDIFLIYLIYPKEQISSGDVQEKLEDHVNEVKINIFCLNFKKIKNILFS